MAELTPMLNEFLAAGEDPAPLLGADSAHMVAYGHELASLRSIPGVTVLATQAARGIQARVDIEAGVQVQHPVHLCFGLLDPKGVQSVQLELTVHAGATATVWSHCLFSIEESARRIRAAMSIASRSCATAPWRARCPRCA